MKVLFDNNVPAPLRRLLIDHEVKTARELGWQELENGNLLTAAEEAGFDVMVTADQNLSYQQNLGGRRLPLVVLSTNRWQAIKERSKLVVEAVSMSVAGSLSNVNFGPRGGRGLRRQIEG